ncbi:MAG: metallopeptidase family protein [Azospirillum sp.]|nr:metallopeptidase family protein [Azospirillum sp.]MCZ8125234.1 metallopeptidase family protein [Magnetospirillum sp.]
MDEPPRYAPDLAEIERLAERARASLPAELAVHIKDVVLRVEDFCDAETEREMALESPYDLLGLYRGVNKLDESVAVARRQPDMIFLYRVPLLAYWIETGEELYALVRHTMIHEIGHHFGFSDDDMEWLEREDAR